MSSSFLISGCQATSSTEQVAVEQVKTERKASAPFLKTEWQLSKISGETVQLHPKQKPINMRFSAEGVAGFSGCNRFSGGYKIADDVIEFLPMMSTRMACHGDDNREMQFFLTLDNVKYFKVIGNRLQLLTADNQVLMVFTASK